MDLAALRATVLDYLDARDENEVFNSGHLDRIINTAYLNVVGKVEMAAPFFNVSSVTPTLTVPSSPPREYDLGISGGGMANPATNIRKVLDCAKRASADTTPYSLRIVDFAKRNAWLGRPGDASNPAPQSAVYFYRTFTTATPAGTWYLGFVDTDPPVGAVLEVRYLPDIVALANSSGFNTPHLVPEAWHYVIALKAAILGKGKENRNAEANVMMYAEALADMQQSLSSAISVPQVQVL